MYKNYFDKKIAFLFSIKNRYNLKIEDGENLNLLSNCLDTLCNSLSNFTFHTVHFYFADFSSDDCIFEQDVIKHVKPPHTAFIKKLSGNFSKGMGYNYILNSIDLTQYDCICFIDADMLFIRNKVLINAFQQVFENKNAYFPVCRRFEPDGQTRNFEFTGVGNCFIPSEAIFLNNLRFIEKYSWGSEDTIFFENIKKYCNVVQEGILGFYHQWHPTTW